MCIRDSSHHKLRQYCTRINDQNHAELNKKEREEFDREMQFVDISNDECDFGMGLETGMNMWHCARFDPAPAHSLSLITPSTLVLKSAVRILTLAYTLLDRDTYIHILLSLIHISEPTRLLSISYAVFCLKKKKTKNNTHNMTYTIF
eukprot:TRINITY_DN53181_c0_g1_i1.p1 TRINITY_DN53181_c0_g1~~TRINITY_DN53181_c0_g1_i1.p1  ORF type:complete len:147 (-),score=32.51 TRINITY_DN53181_c0_g1_i1:90-530(-)